MMVKMRGLPWFFAWLVACVPQTDLDDPDPEPSSSTAGPGTVGSGGADASESTGGTTGSGSGVDETAGLPPFPCQGLCIDVPGEPWRGPLAIATVEEPSSVVCPPGYGQEIATFGHMLINTDEPCECNCATPHFTDCDAMVSVHEAEGCMGASALDLVDFDCTPVDGASIEVQPLILGETCEGWAQEPGSDFDLHTVLCEGETFATCVGEQRCAASPGLDGVVCYWAPGELECPPGFPSQQVVYSAVDDQRTCADGCACAGDPVCVGGVVAHGSCDEAPPARDPLLPGECLDLAGAGGLSPDFSIQGDCTPTVATVPVMGEIFEDAPQTLCCTEPA